MDETATCYGGGDIAGAIFGTLICSALLVGLAWWLYQKYWKGRKAESQLTTEDPENVQTKFAFDNPGFKGDNNKISPLDTKWTYKNNNTDKRKTVDDSHKGNPTPRIVSLRGSDFTGLGIEVCGGLKEGIYVKKVSPQGPAATTVNIGDKITSITIDFQHIVHEDASTILSYASPYNVQLELIDSRGTLPSSTTQSPTFGQHTLTHPLYRSSSQDDFNTIERNARKKLFPSNDDGNYPTMLKMEQQQNRQSPAKSDAAVIMHKENEKKSPARQIKELIEDKLLTKSNSNASTKQHTIVNVEQKHNETTQQDDAAKGLKFGIRVLPSTTPATTTTTVDVNPHMMQKSPHKIQTDNENNLNQEITNEKINEPITTVQLPVVNKRTKITTNKPDENSQTMNTEPSTDVEFQRQGFVTSSGIRRDAAGIPQEIPNEMMQAALAAKDNRKSLASVSVTTTVAVDSNKKSKGKAPNPPSSLMSDDVTDAGGNLTQYTMISDDMDADITDNSKNLSDTSSPVSDRKIMGSDTESHHAGYDHESDNESSNNSTQIELNSKHITVHQTSEEEDAEDNEKRRTASLGDLSKLETSSSIQNGSRSRSGTLERAQSLEITESPLTTKITPKKRKATPAMHETDGKSEYKEPRLSADLSTNMDSLQRGRLKSAYEWGKLEDAIYDTHNGNIIVDRHKSEAQRQINDDDNDDDGNENDESIDMSMVRQVIAVADNYNRENKGSIDDEYKIKQMSIDSGVESTKYDDQDKMSMENTNGSSIVVVQETSNVQQNGKQFDSRLNLSWDSFGNDSSATISDLSSSRNLDDTIKTFLEIEARNSVMEKIMTTTPIKDEQPPKSLSPIHFQYNSTPTEVYTDSNGLYRHHNHHHDSLTMDHDDSKMADQIKIINYGTNMPDDVKVTRYPFGSLERPKSDVLKKLLSQQSNDDATLSITKPVNGTSTTTIISSSDNYSNSEQPISLSIVNNNATSVSTMIDDNYLTETNSQMSPVYSSDGHGINSINISSSMDSITNKNSQSHENIVTIFTDRSQPSSIIVIDDEKLDFTMRTLADDDNENKNDDSDADTNKRFNKTSTNNDEVIIIESLSSKKVPEPLTNEISLKTFVTEICVQTPNNNDNNHTELVKNVADELMNEELILNTTPPLTPITKTMPIENILNDNRLSIDDSTTTSTVTPANNTNSITTTTSSYSNTDTEEYIPRNSEIKFTTSTYESPNRLIDKRHSSHINDIRSAFERNHNSEIPVPVRKTSTSSLRTSPSKIPVFNSLSSATKIATSMTTINNNTNHNNNNNNSSHYGSSDNLNKNNGNVNRVSVSVTSIKNSSRNPSGK